MTWIDIVQNNIPFIVTGLIALVVMWQRVSSQGGEIEKIKGEHDKDMEKVNKDLSAMIARLGVHIEAHVRRDELNDLRSDVKELMREIRQFIIDQQILDKERIS